jgi:hypothetical protein
MYGQSDNPNVKSSDNELPLTTLTPSNATTATTIDNTASTLNGTNNKMNFASGSLRAALAANHRRAHTATSNANDTNRNMNNNNNQNHNANKTTTPTLSKPNHPPAPTQTATEHATSPTEPPTEANPQTTIPTPTTKHLASKYTTAWTCTVAPRKDNTRAEVAPFLKGFLKAIRCVHPPAWIKTHPATTETELKLTDEQDIIALADKLDQFAEDWHYIKNNKLLMRLHIVSDMTMQEIASVPMFSSWLKQQKIQLTISELKSARPMYAGFFKDTLAETKRIPYFKALLDQVYKTNDLFEYQIVVRTLYLEKSRLSAQFFLILSSPEDVKQVRQTFESSAETIGIAFHPWIQYANLEPLQKGSIISDQRAIQDTFRCAIIEGFTNSNPTMTLQPDPNTTPLQMETTIETPQTQQISNTTNVTELNPNLNNNIYAALAMTDEDDESDSGDNQKPPAASTNIHTDPTQQVEDTTQQMAMYDAPEGINMDTTTVTDFIYQYFKNSYEEPMFTEVWQPIAGAIQLFYQAKRRYEVEDLLPILRLETARFMTEESIDFAFTDSELIIADLGSDRFWQPFYLTKQIPPADPEIINPYSQMALQNKRKRQAHQVPRTTPPQYSPYTTSINAMAAIPAEIFANPSEQQQQLQQTKLRATPNQVTQFSPNQYEPSPTTKNTEDKIEHRIIQLCKKMVDESAQTLRNDFKSSNDAITRKLQVTNENIKTDIRTQLAEIRDETKAQLDQQRQELEVKIDATRQDTLDIKQTQNNLQATQESILKGQNDVKAMLESLTQGIQNLKPDCAQVSTPTSSVNNPTAKVSAEIIDPSTQSQSPINITTTTNAPMEDVEPSKKRPDTEATITPAPSKKIHKSNKENLTGYNSWKSLLKFGDTINTPSERAATPSESHESRSEREPLAAKQH